MPSHGSQSEPYQGRWTALAVLLISSFMNLIDVTIVNVALPSMQADFNASDTEIEWVVAAFIVAFSIGLLPFGRLGDMVGRRKVFLVGVFCFTVASALCGVAPSIETLVAARVLQGLAGAMMTPQTLAITQVIFPPNERGSAFSMFGLTAGFAAVAGPLVGGVLIGADLFGLSWRPIFLVNVPVGLAAIVVGLRFIPSLPGHRDVGIDRVGILLAAATLLLVVFPLVEGRNFGWPIWCFVLMALAPVTAFAFVRWQSAQARRGAPQLMPPSVLRNLRFMGGAFVSTLFFSTFPGFFMVLAIFLQVGFGLTPLQSGLTSIPFSVGLFFASMIAGKLGPRHTQARILIGAAMLLVSMIWLRGVVGGIGDDVNSADFLLALVLGGIGLATTISPLYQTVLATVQGRDAGSASGSLQAMQQAGGAFGVAVTGQIFFSHFAGTMAGGSHETFVAAFRASILYGIVAFAVVAIAGLVMKAPAAVDTDTPARGR